MLCDVYLSYGQACSSAGVGKVFGGGLINPGHIDLIKNKS